MCGLHSGKETYLIRETISSLETQLNPKRFLRIHRSTIVNIERIKELQPWFHGDLQNPFKRWYSVDHEPQLPSKITRNSYGKPY